MAPTAFAKSDGCKVAFLDVEISSNLKALKQLELPDVIRIPVGSHVARKIFMLAYTRWEELNADIKLKRYLRIIQAKGAVGSEDRAVLKELRKQATRLRSLYVIFDVDHAAPEEFRDFVRIFGHLNDALEYKAKGRAKKLAKKMRRILKNAAPGFYLSRFMPADQSEVARLLRNELIWLEADFLAARSKRVPARVLHRVRKSLKRIMTVFKHLGQIQERQQVIDVIRYLHTLNDVLGEVNDAATKRSLRKGLKYSHIDVAVPKSVYNVIAKLLSSLPAEFY